ncbi:putative nucleotidyltransferase with HDIG domain [Clostridium tetanomorphum]|uniref:HD-GYP domain-containing protein n=1 Tax=Clostridium tetanomorphum TaxID=1553 RepID=A0A923J0W1_CLOTT|nr:HD-GYP domain-containing protein [Clostridium tetanomorphum]KAJ50883.1 HD domain-containing protein [Clostridium tetanomorphum DSM 665]MBC2397135.1 HD-GYP domain-containing protein [Clostridium tetanomorphum]MBP1863057.1 putative nucleotidyltransferase with HDIG domain [Clostridium tetanomorphum]NRS82886.1 putative nucleotidyltransferase with HDIG domain [Clostridium tetanomorphum]NRZ99018.1 putative nucleotidyltransferase with HDIG domain [Clostridium tetanomorphum]
MRLEFINRVTENDILGKSILTSDGKILLRAGIKLTNTYIKKLQDIGVFYIYVEDERLEDVEVEDQQLSELKQFTMKSMSEIVKNIHSCNGKELRQSLGVVEELVEYIIDLGDVNKSLYDIKTYDNYTYMHSLDTCIMTSFLGLSSGFKENELKELGVGAVLHDVGKTKVPNKILNKKGKLTEEEFNEIKKHTLYGGEILRKNIAIPNSVIDIVEQHHERIDGRGYPFGLEKNHISKFAKVVCICDVYDAVSNDRCYRKKFSPNDAYELILAGSGTSFDKELIKNFKDTFAIYPLGCCVRLSNGEEGYVIKQNEGFPDRPTIRIFYNGNTKMPIPFYEINLLKNPSLVITSIV